MLDPSISYPHQYRAPRQPAVASDRQSRPELRAVNVVAMATCYSPYELSAQRTIQVPVQKDYSKPLHVDCSVEYELPNTAKPPQGVRNEPLLMIHPCYFRKIESQRRSPFVNNLPVRAAAVVAPVKQQRSRMPRGQQLPQQVPHQGAQYPVHYNTTPSERQLWDSLPPLVPITTSTQNCCSKRDPLGASTTNCGSYNLNSNINSSSSVSSCDTSSVIARWTDPDRSPDRPEDKHNNILTGKYRQYLKSHRLHPYVTSAIPLASTFPQMQQVCYNV